MDEHARAVWTKAVPTPRVPDDSGVVTDVLRLVAMIEEMIIEGWRTHGRSLPLEAIAVVGVGEDGVGVRGDLSRMAREDEPEPGGQRMGQNIHSYLCIPMLA